MVQVFFYHHFLENLVSLICHFLCICMMLHCMKTIFFQSNQLLFFIKTSPKKLWKINSFELRNFAFSWSQRKFNWLRIPKLAYAGVFCWDFFSCLHNHQLEFFYQASCGHFHLCIWLIDKIAPKSVPWISTFMRWDWQSCYLWCLFFTIKLTFSGSSGWISNIINSQGSIQFLQDDWKKNFGRCTLLRSPIISTLQELQKSMVQLILVENLWKLM